MAMMMMTMTMMMRTLGDIVKEIECYALCDE